MQYVSTVLWAPFGAAHVDQMLEDRESRERDSLFKNRLILSSLINYIFIKILNYCEIN